MRAVKAEKPKPAAPARRTSPIAPSPKERALALAARVGFNLDSPTDFSAIVPEAIPTALPELADILVDGLEEEIEGPLTLDQIVGMALFLRDLSRELSAIGAKRRQAAR